MNNRNSNITKLRCESIDQEKFEDLIDIENFLESYEVHEKSEENTENIINKLRKYMPKKI
ncbi:hypothetical protein [Paraclostridium sordellii]|uniref:Uncharacterized protein n=1 Tax=Paraclostridium sordellii TaxID=1505 RepID=A0A9P1KWE0_PARSO|nr:hypothetical protein [Paeniclostridium sordellii]CEN31367.1 Uncharacterised protein [[Clostridium] sordellii] [Paeniclostridium sordellii]